MSARRYGPPRARPGQLKAQWGKVADSDPDIVYVGGEGTTRADRWMLHHFIGRPQFANPLSRDTFALEPSFLEELDARGYDITTLVISVEKKRD